MPNSYPSAVNTIATIYKVFSQTYINAREEGTLNEFVCDFLQDEQGRFHFLKIHYFETDRIPSFDHSWKISTNFVDLEQ